MGMLIVEYEIRVFGKYGDVERNEICPSDVYALDRAKELTSLGEDAKVYIKITDYEKMEVRRYPI